MGWLSEQATEEKVTSRRACYLDLETSFALSSTHSLRRDRPMAFLYSGATALDNQKDSRPPATAHFPPSRLQVAPKAIDRGAEGGLLVAQASK